MLEFGYKQAWRALVPHFEALPGEIKELYRMVQAEGETLKQDSKHLGTVGASDKLKVCFAYADPDALMLAQCIIYCLGHWDYRDEEVVPDGWARDKLGCHWKFQSLARQELIRRGANEDCTDWDGMNPCKTKDFMFHKDGTDYGDDEMASIFQPLMPEFEVLKADHVNHRPHPFMIGRKHMENSHSMYLDPRSAPCAMSGCNLSYDEHTSDRVLFLHRLKGRDGDKLVKEEQDCLKSVESVMNEHKMDGFAFVERKKDENENV